MPLSTRSLSFLINELRAPHGRLTSLESHDEPGSEHDFQTLQSQAHPGASARQSSHAPSQPSREEALNYLGDLAKDYHLPKKLVYAVADAESGIGPKLEHHNPPVRDKKGRVVHPVSTDYGLMQINDRAWIGKTVEDAHRHPFKIGQDVKTDWRANARAGVAILAGAYHLATLEQGPGATAEDHAQQAYSQYQGGPNSRDRYLRQRRDGTPNNDADRNFLRKYRQTPETKR